MNKIAKVKASEVSNAVKERNKIGSVSEDSIFGKMISTKKNLKAYLKGEITKSELESMGIEVG
ncbi:hypothetical protein [Dyadobacter sp. CY347]|uniref:hypothetical protein n=1 Tax=Dyadobacter sp. CY347 TaxID=2909336 RepID=UPI001F323B54|nr:hypothetical protein [Dyadobacter sp. CY347]MCF2489391.1 hypothetical protein [Dyadobacter sp. CY347]